jgi:hypothetical protein
LASRASAGARCFRAIAVVLACCLAAGVLAQGNSSSPSDKEKAHEAAQRALPKLSKAASPDKKSYGFEAADDVTMARLGEPYQVFALTAAAVKAYKPSDTVSNLLIATEEWIFPVQCNGSNRVVLIVRRIDEGWKAVYFGNGVLARQLGGLRARWSGKEAKRVTLVSMTDIRSFWFSVQPESIENLSPLADVGLPSGERLRAPGETAAPTPASESLSKLAKALLEMERQQKESESANNRTNLIK